MRKFYQPNQVTKIQELSSTYHNTVTLVQLLQPNLTQVRHIMLYDSYFCYFQAMSLSETLLLDMEIYIYIYMSDIFD